MEVPVTFYPREVASYREFIPIEISGVYQQTIEVRGRGIEMKVRLNPNPKTAGSRQPAWLSHFPHLFPSLPCFGFLP